MYGLNFLVTACLRRRARMAHEPAAAESSDAGSKISSVRNREPPTRSAGLFALSLRATNVQVYLRGTLESGRAW